MVEAVQRVMWVYEDGTGPEGSLDIDCDSGGGLSRGTGCLTHWEPEIGCCKVLMV